MGEKKRPQTAAKLKKLYGLKNITELSKLTGIPQRTLSHVNYGTAGTGITNACKIILALSEALSEKKRLSILRRLQV